MYVLCFIGVGLDGLNTVSILTATAYALGEIGKTEHSALKYKITD